MVSAYDYLSKPIRQYIYEKGWKKLRPIQEATIKMVADHDHNLILVAPTASGKTEAAFLPAISQIEEWGDGVKILALSPLIALINDQVGRIHELCEAFEIPVVAWHGEGKVAQKKKLEEKLSGIVYITPESLEAMLDRKPQLASRLFANLEWIMVDELHSFLGTARGVQLRSLLARLQARIDTDVRFIGMSATISPDNYEDAKNFFLSDRPTSILLDRNKNRLEVGVDYYPEELFSVEKNSGEAATEPATQLNREGHAKDKQVNHKTLYDGIFSHVQQENMLIFPNSRRRVEEIANALIRRVDRYRLPISIFAHHSSVEKDIRLEAEAFAKRPSGLFSICCTSTLELGIDIGAVDAVTQVEAPHSSSSLAQRMGRSGRGEHKDPTTGKLVRDPSKLHFYATNDWSLLQGLAAIEMVQNNDLDPVGEILKPYDILAHQILASVLEYSELTLVQILDFARNNPLWANISFEEIQILIAHLLEEDYLEEVEGDPPTFILGLRAEPVINRFDFYAMFSSEEEYEVLYGRERIGALPLTPEIMVGARILLSAQVWVIVEIEDAGKKIRVEMAKAGKAPEFGGHGGEVTKNLRKKMLDIIQNPPALIQGKANMEELFARLKEQYKETSLIQWNDTGKGEVSMTLFCGTAAERALYLALCAKMNSASPRIYWNSYYATIRGEDLREGLSRLQRELREEGSFDMDQIDYFLVEQNSLRKRMLSGIKYAYLLPAILQARYIRYNLCDDTVLKLL